MCPVYVNIEKMKLLSSRVGIDEPLKYFVNCPKTEKQLAYHRHSQKINFSQESKIAAGCDLNC